MKSLVKVLMVLALGAVICLPGMAGASWVQGFVENGVGNFDTIEAFMITPAGTNFESPGWSAFSDGTWASSTPNPKYALGSGSPVTELYMTLTFTGNQSTPLAFDFLAWTGGLGGTNVDNARAVWNGSSWSIGASPLGPSQHDRSAVPLPPSVLLLGSGLLGLGLLRRSRSLKK